jgi:hypothetical protein
MNPMMKQKKKKKNSRAEANIQSPEEREKTLAEFIQ